MPIISAQELRDVLGVSDSLYDDVYLEQIIASAELTILPMLTAYQSAIRGYSISNGIIYFSTQRENFFVEGQDVVVTGLGSVDGTYTVIPNNRGVFIFTANTEDPDTATVIPVIPAGVAVLDGSSAADLYADTPPIKSAILVVSTEIFQSVTAPGNMTNNVDFNPSPFVLGRSLQNRVIGLLNPFIDVEIFAQ
jgi:hypothetical protein